jgi:outer membrane protein assembly factor BamB
MSTPPDEPGRWLNPFAPEPEDDGPQGSAPPPTPPVMHSPYRPDEELPGQASRQRQPPRFPSLFGPDHHHHGAGHGGSQEQPQGPNPAQTPPPFEQRSSRNASAGWGGGNESYPVPPQFSYNPERQPVYEPPVAAPSRDRRRAIIGVTAVALLAAGVAGVVFLQSGSTKSSKGGSTINILGQDTHTTAGKTVSVAWSAPASGDAATVVGSWLSNKKTIVRGDTGALKAYDVETGKQLWTFPVPGQGASICQMGQMTIQGIGMVQYGPAGGCNTLAAIDTNNGKTMWTQTLGAIPGSAPGTVPMMTVGGDVVAGQHGNSVTVWSATDGRQLWTSDLARANPPCRPEQVAVKSTYVALIEDCGAGPVAVRKDSHTGADLWRTPLPSDGLAGAQITLVEAALPTIVHVQSQALDRYYTFDSQGKMKATIAGTGDYGKLDLNVGPQSLRHPLPHVQDNTFIAPTADKDATAAMAAFDLSTGRELWQTPATTTTGPITVVTTDSDKVTVLDGGTTGSAPRLIAYAMKDGKPVTSGVDGTLGNDWGGPVAAAYTIGDRLIVVPAAPEKGMDLLAFPLFNGGSKG